MVVAIDGPAGAGKSSVARAVAAALGARYLDSGAMYRAVGLLSLRSDRPPAQLAAEADIELGDRVLVDGEDVTDAIRTPDVAAAASRVAADPDVRLVLVERQRGLLAAGDWVAEGRDIGTVVAPDAQLKIFLTASAAERARRRAAESGEDEQRVLAALGDRDARDSGRSHSPLRAADDATQLDTTGLTLDQVVARVVEMARR